MSEMFLFLLLMRNKYFISTIETEHMNILERRKTHKVLS